VAPNCEDKLDGLLPRLQGEAGWGHFGWKSGTLQASSPGTAGWIAEQFLTQIDASKNLHHGADDCGRDWPCAGAEGATAPETLRPKDRSQVRNSGKQA